MEMAGVRMIPFMKKRPSDELQANDVLFAAAIRDYQNNMFRLSKSILRNDHDAMDAVGDAILKAYSKLDSLRSFDSIKPWIMKIVVNESYLIAKKRKQFDYVDEMELNEPNNVHANLMSNSSATANPYDSTDGGLLEIVNELGDDFRAVVILFYYEDMSVRDISKTLGISSGTVKSRLSRARQKLKVALEYDRRLL